jgi:DNA-binding response OmpR family regulator
LLVEADVLVRHPLAEYLRDCGFAVIEAQDEAEAMVLLASPATPIDLMFAEGEGSLALAAAVRRDYPEVQIILAGTVRKATESAAELCEEDGPALVKPYEHNLVLDRIKRLLAARARRQG